jgi:hypothetical protein
MVEILFFQKEIKDGEFLTRIIESSKLRGVKMYLFIQNKKFVLDDKMTGDEEKV